MGDGSPLIDRLLKQLTGVPKPFGGKRILLFGDLLQLPAINPKTPLVFSRMLRDLFKPTFLRTSLRHNADSRYFNILSRMRLGQLTYSDHRVLRSRMWQGITTFFG